MNSKALLRVAVGMMLGIVLVVLMYQARNLSGVLRGDLAGGNPEWCCLANAGMPGGFECKEF